MLLYCETSMHAGAGTGVGRIDLPIQREKHTDFPKIESSSLKGAIREASEHQLDNEKIKVLFGSEKAENSGALGFTDARILLFPIRSAKGIFAWVTCPRALHQLNRDLNLLVDKEQVPFQQLPMPEKDEQTIVFSDRLILDEKIMLEEFVFGAKEVEKHQHQLPEWLADRLFDSGDSFHELLKSNLVILHDDIFTHFVRLFTEVITRNKINNDTGVVEKGALFTEEYLPPHTVLYSIVMGSPEYSSRENRKDAGEVMEDLHSWLADDTHFQVGGNATIGKGIVRPRFYATSK